MHNSPTLSFLRSGLPAILITYFIYFFQVTFLMAILFLVLIKSFLMFLCIFICFRYYSTYNYNAPLNAQQIFLIKKQSRNTIVKGVVKNKLHIQNLCNLKLIDFTNLKLIVVESFFFAISAYY